MFYAARVYQFFVEIGGTRSKPVTLTEQQVSTMTDQVPRLCQAVCNNQTYSGKDDVFRLNTTRRYRVVTLHLDKQYTKFKPSELHYLLNMYHVVQNQQAMYILLYLLVILATVTLSSPSYVSPLSTNKCLTN